MWRRKKFIVAVVLAGVLLAGSIGGVVLAVDDEDNNQPVTPFGTMLDRVCEIYENNTGDEIDPEALQAAFTQAQGEIRTEAMQNRFQHLVEQGKITQEEADGMQEWLEAAPDIVKGFSGFRGHGGFHGMSGMRGFNCPYPPQPLLAE
ncbi:hypothetical protein ACFLXG_02620 [Chloroflexota bacterium]